MKHYHKKKGKKKWSKKLKRNIKKKEKRPVSWLWGTWHLLGGAKQKTEALVYEY